MAHSTESIINTKYNGMYLPKFPGKNLIFFDEKNKRFADMDQMDVISYLNYSRTFKTYRPDFFGIRSEVHDQEDLKLGIKYLNYLNKQRQNEITRMYYLFKANAFKSYVRPLFENFISEGLLDKRNDKINYRWDDASRIVGYLDYVQRRINKYGLQYGFLNFNKFYDYKNMIQDEEDRLVDYLVYEMRKEPVERKYSQFKI